MKKPLLSELTLREKIGQMLAPHQWDVFGKRETDFDFTPAISPPSIRTRQTTRS